MSKADPGANTVAVVLSIGMCTAINLFVVAVLADAFYSDLAGISENATQILTGWGGGIVGVIGAVVGYKSGEAAARAQATDTAPNPPAQDDHSTPPEKGSHSAAQAAP